VFLPVVLFSRLRVLLLDCLFSSGLSWIDLYCGLIYVSLLPEFMPFFRLRVALFTVVFADNDACFRHRMEKIR